MRCIIHIGPAKTGTSTIQAYLDSNRDRFARDRVFIPLTKRRGHHEFGILSHQDVDDSALFRKWRIQNRDDLKAISSGIREQLGRQLSDAKKWADVSLISTEGLAERNPGEINTLRSFLSPYTEQFSVVVYLRRQDLLSVSRYKNRLKNDRYVGGPFDIAAPSYVKMLANWSEIFGKDNVHPLIFPDSGIDSEEHLIKSFLKVCRLYNLSGREYIETGRQNQALDARAIELLLLLNKRWPEAPFKERARIQRVLQTCFDDFIPFSPARENAAKFFAEYLEENERVRRDWFPTKNLLFHERFDMYPEIAVTHLTTADCVTVIGEMASDKIQAQSRRQRGHKEK